MGIDRDLTWRTYRRCLAVFHGVFAPTEAALRERSEDSRLAWEVEPRAALARSDLMELHVDAGEIADSMQVIEPLAPGDDGEAQALGYAYVLEGSAMGATQLAQRVREELPGAPDAFLANRDRGRWRMFVTTLDATLESEVRREQAGRAAQSIFDAFGSLADRIPVD